MYNLNNFVIKRLLLECLLIGFCVYAVFNIFFWFDSMVFIADYNTTLNFYSPPIHGHQLQVNIWQHLLIRQSL